MVRTKSVKTAPTRKADMDTGTLALPVSSLGR